MKKLSLILLSSIIFIHVYNYLPRIEEKGPNEGIVRYSKDNKIIFNLGSATENLSILINIGGEEYKIQQAISGRKDYEFTYFAKEDTVRVRIDRIDANTPYIFAVKVI